MSDDKNLIAEATEIVEGALKGAANLLRLHSPLHSATDVIRLAEIILDRAFLLEEQAATADDDEETWKNG